MCARGTKKVRAFQCSRESALPSAQPRLDHKPSRSWKPPRCVDFTRFREKRSLFKGGRALNAAGGWNTKGAVPCAIHVGSVSVFKASCSNDFRLSAVKRSAQRKGERLWAKKGSSPILLPLENNPISLPGLS